MRNWIFFSTLPVILLVVLLEGMTFSTTHAHIGIGDKTEFEVSNWETNPNLKSIYASLPTRISNTNPVFSSGRITESQPIFQAVTPQVGDGSYIEIASLSISNTITISLHTDDADMPAQPALISTTITAGIYSGIHLAIPKDSQPNTRALFWLQLHESSAITPTSTISVEVQIDSGDEVKISSIEVLTVTTPQKGDGTKIIVDRISTTDTVTLSLHVDAGGVPYNPPIVSRSLEGAHEDVVLEIPVGRRPPPRGKESTQNAHSPLDNTRFIVQIFEKGAAEASRMIPVALELDDEFKSDFITVTFSQISDGSSIVIDRLSVESPVLLSLHKDEYGKPAQSAIASIIISGTYENLSLEIPEDQQPMQDSILWIQVVDSEHNATIDLIPVHLHLDIDRTDRFRVDSLQVSDGTYLTLSELQVYSKQVFVGVLGSKPDGDEMDPDKLVAWLTFSGPRRYPPNTLLMLRQQLSEDSNLWVQLYRKLGDPSSEAQPVKFIVDTVITDFDVQPEQRGNGNGITVALIEASKPVRLQLQDHKENIVSHLDLEGKQVYENIVLTIPLEFRPRIDTPYTVTLYVGETDEPFREMTTSLNLDPVVTLNWNNRQPASSSKTTLAEIQISEPIRVSLHRDEEGKPQEAEISAYSLEQPGVYQGLEFPISTGIPKEDTVFWHRFADAKGNEVYGPIPVTLFTEIGPPELILSSEQYGIGQQIEISRVTTDLPIVVSLHADDEGLPEESPIDFIELSAGEYPNPILMPNLLLSIPDTQRPISDTIYWVQIFDESATNLVIAPISVTLRLIPVISAFNVSQAQIGDGQKITVAELDVTEPITLTLDWDVNGIPGSRIVEQIIEPGEHSNIVLDFDQQLVTDSTFWLNVYSRRQLEPHRSVTVTLDLPTLIDLDVDSDQENDGSFVEIARIAVSEQVTVTLFELGRSPTETITSRVFTPGVHEDARLGIPKVYGPISGTLFLELTHNGVLTLTSPITIWLTVVSAPAKPSETEQTTEEDGDASLIVAKDQERAGFSAILERVVAPRESWVAVFEQQENGRQLVGVSRVLTGSTPNLPVYFNREVPRGAVLWAVMHEDIGEPNVFEYPKSDPPLLTDKGYVAARFVYALPAINVDDNQMSRRSIVVREIIAPQEGWLTLYDLNQKQLLGYLRVDAGRSEGVAVPFNVHVPEPGSLSLLAILHGKNGIGDKAELPIPDSIRMADGSIIATLFNATIDPLACGLTGSGNVLSGDESFLTVDDPIVLSDYSLRIENVCLPNDGWAVVYRDADGAIGDLLGYTRIVGGNPPLGLDIELTPPRPYGQSVWIVLHSDIGQVGRLEIASHDLPVSINGRPAVIYARVAQPPLSGK